MGEIGARRIENNSGFAYIFEGESGFGGFPFAILLKKKVGC